MLRTLVVVWGDPGQGTSSAIHTIITRLPVHFPRAHLDTRIDGLDTQAFITIGRTKIGVETGASRITESLELFTRENCEIIICASSARTVAAFEQLRHSHFYDIVWTSNYCSQDKPIADSNRFFADHTWFLIGEIMADRY